MTKTATTRTRHGTLTYWSDGKTVRQSPAEKAVATLRRAAKEKR